MKNQSLEKFRGIKAKIDFESIIKQYSNNTKDMLQSPTVSPHTDRPGRITPYRLGWTADFWSTKESGFKGVVWNKTNWQLTHLLENGHFITNNGALKWSAPRKHIKPTFDRQAQNYIRDMKNAKIEVDFL